MTDRRRRRLLQAALAAGALPWLDRSAVAQVQDRNLSPAERQPSAPAPGSGGSLLTAPRRALVIGNSNYSIGPLRNPANDATALAAELKRIGFEVTSGIDLKHREMVEMIRSYAGGLARGKPVGLFYFAGHGVQFAWRNYLLPTDAEARSIEDVQKTCVDVNALIEGIGKASNPMNMIILDACRENPFGRDFRVEQKGLSQLDAPPGTFLAFATSPGNVASDGEGANGLYTEHLLREIKVPEAKVEDVFKRVRLLVRRRSNGLQVPWESTSLEEDFYFLPPKQLKKLAEQERERQYKEEQALWEKAQAAEQKRKADAERERLRKEETARQEETRLAEQRRLQAEEQERMKREAIALEEKRRLAEQKRLADTEQQRLRQEQATLQAKLKAAEEKRLAEAERERRAQAEAQAEAQRVAQQVAATTASPIEDYLRQFPSGHFAELAQLELDRVLAESGEKKLQVVSSPNNPYSRGSAQADVAFKVGDRYDYVDSDLLTRLPTGKRTQRVTSITDAQVLYNKGSFATDRAGNIMRTGRYQRTPNQTVPAEFIIGKRWTTRYSEVHTNGDIIDIDLVFRITGREKITVPAGTFDAFVVEYRGWSIPNRKRSAQMIGKIWFAPDQVRREIAREHTVRTVTSYRQAMRSELTAYEQS